MHIYTRALGCNQFEFVYATVYNQLYYIKHADPFGRKRVGPENVLVQASLVRDENGRERRENLSTVPATVFFGRERKRERKNRTGKRNRYYGISGTESIGREHADYDRESITQNGKIHTTTSNI